ncbi:hypothetical protein Tco_0216525 [Tanacetum coccineum]
MSQPANDNFSLHDDEELSLHDDHLRMDLYQQPNKGDALLNHHEIITTNTLSNINTAVLGQKDELRYVGDGDVLPPATQEEQFADEKERKARTLLLMAVLKDHLRRFRGMDDAKEIWAGIKTQFGGNANSKKMQKAVLKQQLDALGAGVWSIEDANHKFLMSPSSWRWTV